MVWLFAGMLYVAFNMILEAVRGAGGGVQEISFQDFKSNLLAKGLVARIEVANGTSAKVFVKPDADAENSPGVLKYFFTIGSVDSFERKMSVTTAH